MHMSGVLAYRLHSRNLQTRPSPRSGCTNQYASFYVSPKVALVVEQHTAPLRRSILPSVHHRLVLTGLTGLTPYPTAINPRVTSPFVPCYVRHPDTHYYLTGFIQAAFPLTSPPPAAQSAARTVRLALIPSHVQFVSISSSPRSLCSEPLTGLEPSARARARLQAHLFPRSRSIHSPSALLYEYAPCPVPDPSSASTPTYGNGTWGRRCLD